MIAFLMMLAAVGSGAMASPPAAQAEAPILTTIEPDAIVSRFNILPTYERAAQSHLRIIGAFAVQEPSGTHLVDAWGMGFLPVNLSFSNGSCFALNARYFGSQLSFAKLAETGCDTQRGHEAEAPEPPAELSLKRIGTSWGYGAWSDAKSGQVLVTVPFSKTFEPFFTARMNVKTIMAMNSPDAAGGDVTLIGWIDGHLTIVTLDVSY